MRLLLLTLLWLVFSNSSVAQTKKADSLRTVLARHPQADTFRVNRLNELASISQKGDSAANMALELAKQLKYPYGQANALFNLAIGKFFAQQRDESHQLLEQALRIAQTSKDKKLQWAIVSFMGFTYQREHDNRELPYLEQALTIAKTSGQKNLMGQSMQKLGSYYQERYEFLSALHWYFQALNFTQQSPGDELGILFKIGTVYQSLTDYDQALVYFQKVLQKVGPPGTDWSIAITLSNIGTCYRQTGRYPQAIAAYQQCIDRLNKTKDNPALLVVEANLADTYERQGNALALPYGQQVAQRAQQKHDIEAFNRISITLGRYYLRTGQADSAIHYAKQGFQLSQQRFQVNKKTYLRDASQVLAGAYAKKKDFATAYTYQNRAIGLKDSLANEDITRKATAAQFSQQMSRQQNQIVLLTKDKLLQTETARRRQLLQKTQADQLAFDLGRKQNQIMLLSKDKQLQTEAAQRKELVRKAEANRLQHQMSEQQEQTRRQGMMLLLSLSVLTLLIGLAVVLYRNNQNKQRANVLLRAQRDQTQQALTELKATQAQLIQKEKMASLGELTAGIAHEIQNPLNFVNNFSEVSTELVDELKEGPFGQLPPSEKSYAEDLLGDLTQNLHKIHPHGQRASSIVKGMLEHSRSGTGEVQPTDINALAEEYLRLAYHGQRAKDKDFTCELVTEFDPIIGQVNVMNQAMGRVLLNLFTNAFYAVRKRQQQAEPDYHPTVTVSTQKTKAGAEIRVSDNGTGIAESVQQKIFQPFFTTKPTGEGTGLGLSLAYDIVTRGHGGALVVESQEGQGTEFIIQLLA